MKEVDIAFAWYSKYVTDEQLMNCISKCHNFAMSRETSSQEPIIRCVTGLYNRNFRKPLYEVIADTSRCEVVEKNKVIKFIGRTDDAEFCAALFQKLYTIIVARSLKEYSKNYLLGNKTINVFNERADDLIDKISGTLRQYAQEMDKDLYNLIHK